MKHFVVVLMACFMFSGVAAFAAAPADESDVFDLGEIIVSATRLMAPQPGDVVEVTARDIEESGAKNVAEALEFTNGVRVSTGSKDEADVRLRGFDRKKILVLLDGTPLTSPYDGYMPLNQIPVENISKITVVKGISSALYGGNAMGGVINIVTKKVSGKAAGSIKYQYGELGAYGASLQYSLPFNKNKYISLSGSNMESNGFKMSDKFPAPGQLGTSRYENGGRRVNSDYNQSTLSFKIGRNSEKSPIFLSFSGVDNEKGMPVNTINPSGMTAFARFDSWKSWTGDLSAEQKFCDRFSLREKFFYHSFKNTFNMYTAMTPNTYIFNEIIRVSGGAKQISLYDDNTYGMRLDSTLKVTTNHTMQFALNLARDTHKGQGAVGAPWEKDVSETHTLAAESDVTLSERLAFVVGASYDEMIQKSRLNFSGASKKTAIGGRQQAFNPLFNLSITPDETNTVRASWGRKTRFPSQNELYSFSKGNPNLNPEMTETYELDVDHKLSDMYVLSGSYFHNDVKNLINCPVTGTCTYINISSSLFKGYEIALEKTKGKLTGKIGETILSARDREKHINIDNIPRRQYDLSLNWKLCNSLAFNMSGTYASARFFPMNTAPSPKATSSYKVMNAGVSGKIKMLNAGWRVFVDNVFDRNYDLEPGFPQEGRTVHGELQYNF